MSARISQREARGLRIRVRAIERELTEQRRSYASEWPGGTHIATTDPGLEVRTAVKTARRLGHAVVATLGSEGNLYLHALPLAKP
jgi:hypothetical protein